MDTYGAITLPVEPPLAGVEVADPGVTLVAQFAQAVLNAYGQAAYSAVCPPVTGLQTGTGTLTNPVVRKALERDPSEEEFAESDLPAVFVFRNGGEQPFWLAEDYRVEPDTWTLLWLFQPAPQATRTRLKSFVNGIVKILDARIESMRDPSYVAAWDPDPTAPTTPPAPAAIKNLVASSALPQTYAGAALDGAAGGAPFAPVQLPTVTVTGAGCSGTVSFTGLGSDGEPRVSTVAVDGTGTFYGNFLLGQVTEVDVSALAPGSSLSFGLAGFVGLGTNVLVLGGLMELEITKWRQFRWTLQMGDASPRRTYPHAVEVTLKVVERWTRAIPATAAATAVDTQYPISGTDNSSVRQESIFFT